MTKNTICGALISCIAMTGGGFVTSHANAQSEGSGLVLEEIVVSARKREESVLDVPFGITALTADDLEASNLKDIKDIQAFTPGFFFAEFGAGRVDRGIRNFVMRGINVGAFVNANDAAIAFVDGAPVVSGEISSFTDVERIEVLRGPQSAYFGRNTFSGAINVITKTPGDEWAGKVGAEYASPGSTDLSLSVEGPVVENRLSVRLGARHIDKRGDYTNAIDGTPLGDRETKTVSGMAYATPSDNLSIKLYGEYARFDDGPGASGSYNSITESNCDANGDGQNNWFCGVVPEFDTSRLSSEAYIDSIFRENVMDAFALYDPIIKKPGLAKENVSLHGIVDYEFANGMSLESITAYHKSKADFVLALPGGRSRPSAANPFRVFSVTNIFIQRDFEDFSQEFRLSSAQDERFRWTLGGSYVHPSIVSAAVSAELDLPPPVTFLSLNVFPRFTSDTFGYFGGAYYDITDSITVSAEARYQIDDVTVDVPGLERKFKSFAPRLTAEYKPTEDWTIFANWARGFRPGAFNARLLTFAPDIVAEIVRQTGAVVDIDEERIDMYEIGAKGSFWDQRANVSVIGYMGEITNQQITNTAIVDITGDGQGIQAINVVSNLGSTDLQGIELEGAVLFPVGGENTFLLNGTFAWNDVEFQEFICLTCLLYSSTSDVAGNSFPKAPKYSASLVGTYTHPLNSGMDVYGRVEYLFRGSLFATEANLAKTGSSNKLNLRIGIEKDTWSLEGFVTNITNDDTPLSIERQNDTFNAGRNSVHAGFADLRNYGVRVNYRF